MPREAIPLTVVGGYLAAGKTTVINSLLRRAGGRRLGIVVNDFGEVNVDAQILRRLSDGVVELAGGCVCCDLSLGMGPALAQLLSIEPPPAHVLVEVSGVGEPGAVAAWGHTPGFRPDGVAVVVPLDRIRALAGDRWVADLVIDQVGQADLLVCTRGDLLDVAEQHSVTAWLRQQSPAPQVLAPHGEVPVEVILGFATPAEAGTGAVLGTGTEADLGTGTGAGGGAGAAHGVQASSFVRASTWRSATAVDISTLESRLGALAGLLRAKGFARPAGEGEPVLVQAVGGHVECTPWLPEPGAPTPVDSVLTVLTTPEVADMTIAEALPGWRRTDHPH